MKLQMYRKHMLKQNQSGMVAIPVTIILMIIISLITIGFSTTIRKEQRQALDNQLSSQAFYAAESGVNVAAQKLKDNPDPSSLIKSDCGPSGVFTGGDYTINGSGIDDASGTTITCLLIKPINDLQFTGVGGTSKISLIDTETVNINSIYINWQNTNGSTVTTCNLLNTFPSAAQWSANCSQPILRVDLVPISNTMTPAALRAQQFTAFLYPKKTASGGITANFGDAVAGADGKKLGAIFNAGCNETTDSNKTQKCMAVLNNVVPGTKYAIRIISLYGTSNVRVHVRGPGDIQPDLKNAQALVDSTARSVDVLRRVQVRLPLVSSSNVPDFALSAGDGICKRYSVTATDVNTDSLNCDDFTN